MRYISRLFLFAVAMLVFAGCENHSTTVTPKLDVVENSIDVWFDTASYEVEVKSTHDWVATTDCDWIVVETPSGEAGNAALHLSFESNAENASREGVVSIESSAAQLSATLTVRQFEKRDEWMQIVYETTDGKEVEINVDNPFNANIVSNTYSNGEGVIKFDATLTSIGGEAFYGNEALKRVVLPESVTTIGDWVFSGCSYLLEAGIPKRVKAIGDMAFAYCNQLQEVVIPQSVATIGDSAFCGCSGLKRIAGKFATADERCLVINNVLVQFAPKGCTSYVIPDGISTIEHDAFYESLSLRSVTIPSSVKKIGDCAFYYCESLKEVYCKSVTPPTLGTAVFDNYDSEGDEPIGCKIYVPAESVEAYKSAKNWDRYKGYINAENTITNK